MLIRSAKNEDGEGMYNLHVNSIKYYCSDFYSKESIEAWLELKKPEDYTNSSPHNFFIIAEEKNGILY